MSRDESGRGDSGHDDESVARDEARRVLDADVSDLLADAEVVRERRPAKMVTALRIDLYIQAEIETAAAARGIGASTLMREIIVDWVEAHRQAPPPDRIGELVRHLDAARRVAASLEPPTP